MNRSVSTAIQTKIGSGDISTFGFDDENLNVANTAVVSPNGGGTVEITWDGTAAGDGHTISEPYTILGRKNVRRIKTSGSAVITLGR